MPRTVSIGRQDFEKLRENHNFYVDKTLFIKEWWEADDEVTLITRPRRFGKTLTMSMVEKFFSVEYADRSDLFKGLHIWEEEKYRGLQGTYPVISISFAGIKEADYATTRRKICQIIAEEYVRYDFLLEGNCLAELEKAAFHRKTIDMDDVDATLSLNQLSLYLSRYYGKKVIILLDEYDTPMQEAYVNGYWEEMAAFTRSLFNATFKTNRYLERAIMTGITRVSRESMFSDLNNLKVVTTTSERYSDCFGFTEGEVFAALEEFGLSDRKEEVKQWYDGFSFGSYTDIYNPWSIINYLDTGEVASYWANTSSNSLAEKLIREGSPEIKMTMESLLQGKTFHASFDEQIVFSQLGQGDDAVWSLFLACGYLKVMHYEFNKVRRRPEYDLKLTNMEVQMMFEQMVEGWFGGCRRVRGAFLQALLADDLETMNEYMNDISSTLFSSFDTGKKPSEKTQPERFYHGFVLGLMVELRGRYIITSNRESGLGRYDIMLEPLDAYENAFVIEFKVAHTAKGETLENAVEAALEQIEKKQYETVLRSRGIPEGKVRKYGFAFAGSRVLIGKAK